MPISASIRKQICAEAVDWLLVLENPNQTALDRQEFSEWLLRSPVHLDEFLAVSSVWEELGTLRNSDYATESLIRAARSDPYQDRDNVVGLRDHGLAGVGTLAQSRARHVTRRHLMGVAASLVLGTGVWLGYRNWTRKAQFQTAVGEQRRIELADGSVVFLNTDTDLRVSLKRERHIDLSRGEARFQVAKDPSRPFMVATTQATVHALGTIFNVRAIHGATQVAVLEGRVKVDAMRAMIGAVPQPAAGPLDGVPGVELVAGERAAITADQIELNVGPTIESVAAWANQQLVFRDESLAEVVAEFNRYRIAQLVIDDPKLAALKINGIIGLNDPNSLVEFVRSFEAVQIAQWRNGSVHL